MQNESFRVVSLNVLGFHKSLRGLRLNLRGMPTVKP